ncbi:MAG: penicillin-binding protein activator [Gammaproteobacteria bacterium]|nr:penicillin-binding protein activator [Gammaproteobacteria bacterium]
MPIKHRTRQFLLITSLVLLLLGCAPATKREPAREMIDPTLELQQEVAALLEAGEPGTAARQLESRAQLSESPLREQLLLQAGEIWSGIQAWDQVARLVQILTNVPVTPTLRNNLRMLQAELAISRQDLDLALDLMHPPIGDESSVELRQRFHRNMAEIFRLTGNLLESARELVELDRLLAGEETQLENQLQLVKTLSSMTDAALALLQPEPPGLLGAWMDLVRIFKRRNEDPVNFDAQLKAWQETFPEHPALEDLLTGYIDQQTIDQSHHIAVLLPYSGPFAKVSASLRDGFMAAWYQRRPEKRPVLRFYDSSDAERILELYQQAVLQGAQLIVGPLDKHAVQRLIDYQDLQVPILALNQVAQTGFPTPNLFQFGLAPEDEAEQVAERAWLDGHTKALALTPRNSWGNRLLHSFRNRWESLGGYLLEHQTYDAKENDFSRPIRLLLNTDDSRAREQDLQKIIGVPMETEPRRRQDADYIFLVARAQKGRQIRPQLRFHHAGNLQVYTTSHIYSSIADVEKDKDLGQLKFVDTPWLLEEDSESRLSRENLKKLIPGVQGNYARFYAMGIDAFNLLPHLQVMGGQTAHIMQGKTGNLYLDSQNRIHRQLAWAEMEKGRARITGYAPRLERSNHPVRSGDPTNVDTNPYPVTGHDRPASANPEFR